MFKNSITIGLIWFDYWYINWNDWLILISRYLVWKKEKIETYRNLINSIQKQRKEKIESVGGGGCVCVCAKMNGNLINFMPQVTHYHLLNANQTTC